MASINELFLIPPIFDAIVDHLSTIDLLKLYSVNRTIHDSLRDSRSAWRALSFTRLKPTRPCACHKNPRPTSGSSFSNQITSRSHFGGLGRQKVPAYRLDVGTGKNSLMSIDRVLTFIGRTLRLNMYTSLDLSRTMADASLVRNLLDNCTGLVWLGLADCPNIEPSDMLLGMFGLEKAFLQEVRAQRARESAKIAEAGVSLKQKSIAGRERIESNSIVVEFMSRPKLEADPSSRLYANSTDWFEEGTPVADLSYNEDETDSGSASRRAPVEQSEATATNQTLVLPLHVQAELTRLRELTICLNRSELEALLENGLIEDAYLAPNLPPSPPVLENRPFKLRHVTFDINLAAAKPPMQSWLYTALWKPETYLFLMGYLMGVKIDCACDGPL